MGLSNIFQKNKEAIPKEIQTANEFINIKDIQKNYLYTNSGYILTYLKIFPKNTTLMNKEEQYDHAKSLTSEFVLETKPFKIYFTNKPVDTSKNIDYQNQLLQYETDDKKIFFLTQRMQAFNRLGSAGEVLEGETFIVIWEKNGDYAEAELDKRMIEMEGRMRNARYKTKVLEEKEIIQLVNSYTNPTTAYNENQNYLEFPMEINKPEGDKIENKRI